MIPENISRQHIESAILSISENDIPPHRKEVHYVLVSNGKLLPPKYVLSIANKLANGTELNSNDFNAVEAKNFLEKRNFSVIDKRMQENSEDDVLAPGEFFPELKKFLAQSKTSELGTVEYLNSFQGFTVKVSFGKGNQARIPWIAFLNSVDNVQDGIYPVYLYYKEKDLLILAYGVSETNKPNRTWNISNGKLIEEYFIENNLGRPERYGKSYIFKTYDTKKELTEKEIDDDLNLLLSIYKKTQQKPAIISDQFNAEAFYKSANNAGLFVTYQVSIRLISALLSKPFLILTGLSGSGKTKIAQAFAKWICESDIQYKIIPVGSDWTNREPLFGYPNALEKEDYILPDNGSLSLIIEATKEENQHKPYFLILDEMNLSHVERYFADFLSAMESGESIPLHNGKSYWEGVPTSIKLPKNLFIIGTVNIDETTYMFSPKVLDRANVIEFRVTEDEMRDYLSQIKLMNLNHLNGMGAGMASNFIELAKDKSLQPSDHAGLNRELIKFFSELKKTGAEFGYRTATEINRFVAVVNMLEPTWSIQDIIDVAVMQKLLPKVHGSRRKLEPVLKKLGELCLKNPAEFDSYIKDPESSKFEIKYPISLEKISRMYNALHHNGFTSYAEA